MCVCVCVCCACVHQAHTRTCTPMHAQELCSPLLRFPSLPLPSPLSPLPCRWRVLAAAAGRVRPHGAAHCRRGRAGETRRHPHWPRCRRQCTGYSHCVGLWATWRRGAHVCSDSHCCTRKQTRTDTHTDTHTHTHAGLDEKRVFTASHRLCCSACGSFFRSGAFAAGDRQLSLLHHAAQQQHEWGVDFLLQVASLMGWGMEG